MIARWQGIAGLVPLLTLFWSFACAAEAAEEFAGPFPSWRNVKTYYGAVGDGKADDTAALQRALDDLTLHRDFCVLYLPAGTYRLTKTIRTLRKNHSDGNGIAVVGESPESTILRWDGPEGGRVVQYDAWYSRISRLTIDGAGRASVDLAYGPAFSTYNEASDLVLRDAKVGLLLGDGHTQGQAENEVLRCRFSRCADSGLKTDCYNSLDIWVWYCSFADCGHALFNGSGDFHAWENVFQRSTVADVGSGAMEVFSFVDNTSVGSKRFIDFPRARGASPSTISGNRVLNPVADCPVRIGTGGPTLVMDNVFKLPAGSTNRAIEMSRGAQTLVGNSYSRSNAVQEAGHFRRVAERVVDGRDMDETLPVLPATPPRQNRRVIEVPRNANGRAIQAALDEAARPEGQQAVVHLPPGLYQVSQTLVIPAESDVQLIGDGAGYDATRLHWAGPAGGLLLDIKGPSQATLRDFDLDAPGARALLVEDADQEGGRIFADQLRVDGPTAPVAGGGVAVSVNGLVKTDVLFRCLQGGGGTRAWFEVVGPAGSQTPAAGLGLASPAQNQISVFTGFSSGSALHYTVLNGAALVVRGVYHEASVNTIPGIALADAGNLALDACHFTYFASEHWPLIALQDFQGYFTLATSLLNRVGAADACRLELTGNGAASHALELNDLFPADRPGVPSGTFLRNRSQPPAEAALVECGIDSPGSLTGGFHYLSDLWTPGSVPLGGDLAVSTNQIPDSVLLQHLAPLRSARVWLPSAVPAHVTNLLIYRVLAAGGPGTVVKFSATN